MELTIYIIISIVLWGVSAVFEKIAMNTGEAVAGLTIRSIVVFTSLMVILFISGKFTSVISLVKNDTRATIYFALSGLLAGLIAMLTYYKALHLAPSSQVVPITSTYPLITALLGMFLLKEEFSLPRLAGVLLIVTGVYLVQMKANNV